MDCAITHLYIYPVKSLSGISLPSAKLTRQGLEYDRQWMLVDDKGRFISQRQCPALAAIKTQLTAQALLLQADGHPTLTIALDNPPQQRTWVQVWDDNFAALDEGDDAAQWFKQVLAEHWPRPLRMVRFAQDGLRAVSEKHLKQGEHADTHFADGYPYLIANQSSLDALNQHLATQQIPAISMDRFRANIVVSGWQPWQENQIDSVEHNGYQIGLRKPCERCPMITVNQQTGERQTPKGEPLKALAELATLGADSKGAYFGQNAILLNGEGATIRVGDRLHTNTTKGR